jgi:hypothetical protein
MRVCVPSPPPTIYPFSGVCPDNPGEERRSAGVGTSMISTRSRGFNSSGTKEAAMGTSTTRVRALRERRRQGMSLFKIRLSEAQIEVLVSKGYLDRQRRDDDDAVSTAAEGWLRDEIARSRDARTGRPPGRLSQSS